MQKFDAYHYLVLISLISGAFVYFKTGNKRTIILISVAFALYIGTLFCREPAESFKDAAIEAAKAATEIVVGAAHAVENPALAAVNAVDAGQHLSDALDHLKEGMRELDNREKAELERQERLRGEQAYLRSWTLQIGGNYGQPYPTGDNIPGNPYESQGTLDRDTQYECDRSAP